MNELLWKVCKAIDALEHLSLVIFLAGFSILVVIAFGARGR